MDIMEEGEIPSSPEHGIEDEPSQPQPPPPHNSTENPFEDDILDEQNYVIIERPKSSLPMRSNSLTEAKSPAFALRESRFQKGDQQPQQSENASQQANMNAFGCTGDTDLMDYSQFGEQAYYKKVGVSDLFENSDKEEESSSGSSDSDDYHVTRKRTRMGMPSGHQFQDFNSASCTSTFGGAGGGGSLTSATSMPNLQYMNSSSSLDQSEGMADFFAKATKFQNERPKPNLVWANVLQEEEISKLGQQVRVGGGLAEVEFTRGPETYFYQRACRQPRERRPSDSSDISSEGLIDNALHYLKDGEIKCDEEEDEDKDVMEQCAQLELPKSFSGRRTSKRRKVQKHKNKIINKLRKMKGPELAKYMAIKLKEDKDHLILRAIEILGKEVCIRTFLKTLKIEKRGGIMVKTQERRRTGGGVFLYLIRGDRRITKRSVDLIFREEKAYHDKVRKKKVANKRLLRKEELEGESTAVVAAASGQSTADASHLSL